MSFFSQFQQRARDEEQMDRPDCDPAMLFRTLDQFHGINRCFSRARALLRRTLLADMRPGRGYHLVDLGAGACDLPVWLLAAARRRRLDLRITAVDADPRIIRYARERYGHIRGLEIREGNALEPGAFAPFDYLFANHFLHHLTDEEIAALLEQAHRLCGRGFVFSDLRRSPWSYLAFSLFARVYRNSFSRADGLISIRKAFRPEDFRAIPVPLTLRTRVPGRIQSLGGGFHQPNEKSGPG